jgi:hypothetical protein
MEITNQYPLNQAKEPFIVRDVIQKVPKTFLSMGGEVVPDKEP